MEKKLSLIVLSFMIICCLFAINALAEPWNLPIKAKGQGLHVSNVVIGMETDTNEIGTWPAAPLMPNFAAVITVIDPNAQENGEDIRSDTAREDWNLKVIVGEQETPYIGDPNSGSVADASDPNFFPELNWNPNEILPDRFMQLRLGEMNGPLLVSNMKTANTYQTTEADALDTGEYDPGNDKASMRYKVTSWASEVVTQNIDLISGWNWVSFYVLPDDTSLGSFFGAHGNLIKQVKTQTRSATNLQGIGWIGDDMNIMSKISEGAMFKIQTIDGAAPFTLSVAGLLLPRDMTIEVQQNWTWIAYLPGLDCLSVEESVSSVLGDLFQIKSQTASKTKVGTILIGDLTDICPGKGIVVKMNAPGFLTYPNP